MDLALVKRSLLDRLSRIRCDEKTNDDNIHVLIDSDFEAHCDIDPLLNSGYLDKDELTIYKSMLKDDAIARHKHGICGIVYKF
jgi:hypothetical protein